MPVGHFRFTQISMMHARYISQQTNKKMKNRVYRHLIGILGVVLALVIVSSAETWNGITPLKSTRADVENILGKPNEYGYYQRDEGKVRIFYGAGDLNTDTCWGRASKETVTRISISLGIAFNLKDVKTDRNKLEKTVDSNHPSNAMFSNWEDGIQYDVSLEDGEIYSINYLPNQKDCEELLRSK